MATLHLIPKHFRWPYAKNLFLPPPPPIWWCGPPTMQQLLEAERTTRLARGERG